MANIAWSLRAAETKSICKTQQLKLENNEQMIFASNHSILLYTNSHLILPFSKKHTDLLIVETRDSKSTKLQIDSVFASLFTVILSKACEMHTFQSGG